MLRVRYSWTQPTPACKEYSYTTHPADPRPLTKRPWRLCYYPCSQRLPKTVFWSSFGLQTRKSYPSEAANSTSQEARFESVWLFLSPKKGSVQTRRPPFPTKRPRPRHVGTAKLAKVSSKKVSKARVKVPKYSKIWVVGWLGGCLGFVSEKWNEVFNGVPDGCWWRWIWFWMVLDDCQWMFFFATGSFFMFFFHPFIGGWVDYLTTLCFCLFQRLQLDSTVWRSDNVWEVTEVRVDWVG